MVTGKGHDDNEIRADSGYNGTVPSCLHPGEDTKHGCCSRMMTGNGDDEGCNSRIGAEQCQKLRFLYFATFS